MASPVLRSSPVTGSVGWATGAAGVDCAGAAAADRAGAAEPEEPPVPEPPLVDGVVAASVDLPAPEPELVGAGGAAGAASTTIVPCMNG